MFSYKSNRQIPKPLLQRFRITTANNYYFVTDIIVRFFNNCINSAEGNAIEGFFCKGDKVPS
jgi:hypothetical protein